MLTEPIRYDVVSYSDDALATALTYAENTEADIRQSLHFRFFTEYLGAHPEALNAQTILTEEPYVSRSYLADYAHYYAFSFTPYQRHCRRVHFFSIAFTRPELDRALTDDPAHPIWQAYLGYIVVKPLPNPIGPTLLQPYAASAAAQRCYPATREYPVNLLGRVLKVRTLLYQQQDSNVSACATTAIWMAFSKTAHLFQTPSPAPYQITASAGSQATLARSFPNRGLNAHQILQAIESVGLVTEIRTFNNPENLVNSAESGESAEGAIDESDDTQDQEYSPTPLEVVHQINGFVYAHLRMGLPVLLFTEFGSGINHLITAAGYRLGVPPPISDGITMPLVSDQIDRLYAHDDGIGPFARLTFRPDGLLESGWPSSDFPPYDWSSRAAVYLWMAIVPISPKVRIKYEEVYGRTAELNAALGPLVAQLANGRTVPTWDIFLSYSNQYKEEVLKMTAPATDHRRWIVTRHLPRYVWVARAQMADGAPLLELVFDATDLHTGFYCLLTNVFEPLRTLLQEGFLNPDFEPWLRDQPGFDPRYLPLLKADLAVVTTP